MFRCHNCFNILKLEKNFVQDVKAGKIPTIAELNKFKKKNIIEYMRELEAKSQPKVVHANDPMAVAIRTQIEEKEVKYQHKEAKKGLHVNIGPNCSKIIMSARKNCPSCGFVLF